MQETFSFIHRKMFRPQHCPQNQPPNLHKPQNQTPKIGAPRNFNYPKFTILLLKKTGIVIYFYNMKTDCEKEIMTYG